MAGTALGQANFELRNRNTGYGVDAPVFDAQGIPLAGPGFSAELWGGPTPDSLQPVVAFYVGQREIVPFLSQGYFSSSKTFLTVTTVPPNGWAWLEVRAWNADLGTTYEEVAASGLGGYGESPLFYAQGGNAFDLNGLPAPLIGLESFSLRPVVPEPSAWLLVLLGFPVVWWRMFKPR